MTAMPAVGCTACDVSHSAALPYAMWCSQACTPPPQSEKVHKTTLERMIRAVARVVVALRQLAAMLSAAATNLRRSNQVLPDAAEDFESGAVMPAELPPPSAGPSFRIGVAKEGKEAGAAAPAVVVMAGANAESEASSMY